MNKVVELTDNELIQSFQGGNTRAFDALIDRYQEKIFNTILFMVKDSYLAEDLIQEIFIKIIASEPNCCIGQNIACAVNLV